MKPDNEKNTAASSIPAPPPLPLPELSLKVIKLRKAEQNAWAAGVPNDISERELFEANERIKVVEAAEKNQVKIKDTQASKEKELTELKDKIEHVNIKISTIKKEIENLEESYAKRKKVRGNLAEDMQKMLNSGLKNYFNDLKDKARVLDEENSTLERLNSRHERLEGELSEIIKMLSESGQELFEANKKLMPRDKEKSDLFNARKENKKAVNSKDRSEETNDKKKEAEEFENFDALFDEREKIKGEIKKLEERKFNDQVGKLDELKKRLQKHEVKYQCAFRPGQAAVNYELKSRITDKTEDDVSNKPVASETGRSDFFKKPVDITGLEKADTKGANKPFYPKK